MVFCDVVLRDGNTTVLRIVVTRLGMVIFRTAYRILDTKHLKKCRRHQQFL